MKKTKSKLKKSGLFSSKKSQAQLKVVIAVVLVAIVGFGLYMLSLPRTITPQQVGINQITPYIATSPSPSSSCKPMPICPPGSSSKTCNAKYNVGNGYCPLRPSMKPSSTNPIYGTDPVPAN